jgi:hypothetical protein
LERASNNLEKGTRYLFRINGVIDNEVYPDESATPVTYEVLIDVLKELAVPYKHSLIRKVQIAQRFDDNGKERLADMLLQSVQRSVNIFASDRLPSRWRITEEEKNELNQIISELRSL